LPSLIIIAGPNGAGKTTFATEYLSLEDRDFEFVNADEIARGLTNPQTPPSVEGIRSGRMMLERIGELVDAGTDFAIETTLASLTYARKIPAWRRRGFVVSIVYLRLPTVVDSLARVRKRVEAGGHNIPEDTIRRRFDKSAVYLEQIYKPIVDEWYIWESREGGFTLTDSWDRQ
jgi:predicted ABC-type ATPase